MIRALIGLTLLSFVSLSCSDDSITPYDRAPKFSKNVSTLFGFDSVAPADGSVSNFTWKDSNGVLRSMSDLRGKVVVVNFWATWCGPCLQETPALRDIANDFRKDSVVVIGISIDRDGDVWGMVEEFHRSKHLSYQVIIDPDKDVYSVFQGTYETMIPSTFIIDRDGLVYTSLLGAATYEQFANTIRAVL
jgi:peroxiredoxin